jgi:hypothetical protein
MTTTLLEEVNPHGNIQAVVEHDESVCFLYLYPAPETGLGMRSVWVRNLAEAPEALDVAAMQAGRAPRNPRQHCRTPSAGTAPVAEALRVVWLPEGNGVALYERDEILAIIPPWSGVDGFHGYARDAVGDGSLAWELTRDNALHERFAQAEQYWRKWERDTMWSPVQGALMSRYEQAFGAHRNYYAIDGGGWPPRALVRTPWRDAVLLTTVGVSLLPHPNVEMATKDPRPLRRIELGACLPAAWPDELVKQFASYLSGQARLPWAKYTWLGAGHTIPCDSWRNRDFVAALLADRHPAAPTCQLEPFCDDPVTLLWFLPISPSELDRARAQGSAAVLNALPPDRWKES